MDFTDLPDQSWLNDPADAEPMEPTLSCFKNGGDTYSSPNCHNFPEALASGPPHRFSRDSRSYDICNPTWYDPDHPFLAFMPATSNYCSSLFLGPIFERLNVTFERVEIERFGHDGYRLAASRMQAWIRLEVALDYMLQLLSRYRGPDRSRHFEKFNAYPESFGYKQLHSKAEFARRCAIRSRDAFVPLCAYLSYAIALCSDTEDDFKICKFPRWLLFITKNPKINASWMDDLRASFVCNFSFGFRAGCFFEYSSRNVGADAFEAFLRAGIPIWICWGRGLVPPKAISKVFETYLPDINDLRDVERKQDEFQKNSALTARHAGTVVPSFPNSGQQNGETPEIFMRLLDDQEREQLSSCPQELKKEAETRKKHEQGRMKADQDHYSQSRTYEPQFYPEASSYVFEWVSCGPWLLRKPLFDDEIWRRWRAFSPSQKKYHPLLDVWDLCSSFNPSLSKRTARNAFKVQPISSYSSTSIPQSLPAFSYDDLGDGGDDGDDDNGPIYPENADNAESRPAPSDLPMDAADTELAVISASDLVPNQIPKPTYDEIVGLANRGIVFEPFLQVLETWFGFAPEYQEGPVSQNWADALMTFGVTTEIPGNTSGSQLISITEYHDHIITAHAAVSELSDLYPNHRDHQRLLHSAPHFELRILQAEGKPLYIVGLANHKETIENQWYVLAFTDAATVLAVFRSQWATGMLATVRGLVARGARFQTVRYCRLVKAPNPPTWDEDAAGLRLSGYKFTVQDYQHYMAKCRAILRGSNARAALLAGGIIWRLALDFVDIKRATEGPSQVARGEGKVYARDGEHFLYDDVLDANTAAILCGMYCLPTGKFYIP